MGCIDVKLLWVRKNDFQAQTDITTRKPVPAMWQIALPILIAAGPLLVWSAHNQRVFGFFGISDYGGAALYDGWIYFGEKSRIPITDPGSAAVQTIEAVYGSQILSSTNLPTSWTVYYALMKHGYTSEQAFTMLEQATLDSMRKNLRLTWKLLQIKFQQGFEPHSFTPSTFPLPGEKISFRSFNSKYFDPETISVPIFIRVQRGFYKVFVLLCPIFYRVWFWLGVGMLFIGLYRKPFFTWVPLASYSVSVTFAVAVPVLVIPMLVRYTAFSVS